MDPLEAALGSSFTAPNVPVAAPKESTPKPAEQPGETKTHAPTRSVDLEAERLAAADDSWKGEYDERLNSWRAENAERRTQSEKTRQEWEQRRSSKEYAESYTVPTTTGSSMASSFVDARDLVSGEHEGGHGIEALDHVLSPSAKGQQPKRSTASGSGEDDSRGWEKVAPESLTSSYPSLNFPPLDSSGAPARSGGQHPSASQTHARDGKGPSGAPFTLPPIAPPSVTLSIFDTTLSKRARFLALTSSLAINLLLPFINGIMLGFGEIAAKSLFGWSGWRDVASGLGLRSAGTRRECNRPGTRGKDTPTLLTMP